MEKENKEKSTPTKRLMQDDQELGSNLYDNGVKTINKLKDEFQEHTDYVVQNVKEKPFTSLLIAAGIGFILSRLLKP